MHLFLRSGYDYSSLYSQYYGSGYPYSMATGTEQEHSWTKALTQNIFQASLPGLEGASRPRVATTLEGLLRHTTTHMQASTVRQEPLTGNFCWVEYHQHSKEYFFQINLCKIQGPAGPNLVVRDNGQLMVEKATRNCLQKSVSWSNLDNHQQSLSQIFSNDSPLNTAPIC